MTRVLRAAALSALILFPAAGVAAAAEAPAPDAAPPKGAVGLCVRWGADPTKLAEVVLVKPSGDPRVDAMVPEALRAMPFPKPDGDTGAWRAMSVGVGGAEPLDEAPDCGSLASTVDEPIFTRPLPRKTIA